jgi:pilus assembly protein FimV
MMLMACLLSLSSLWPSLSSALGLGEIHLNSALNEPLNAEIDLIAAAPDELAALRATLASRDSFTRYGIDRPPFLSSLTFKVGKSKDGRDVLLVHSTEAIPEPFVTFLVEVNWARGRLMREYTVLLDPPVYTPGESPGSSAPVVAANTNAPASGEPAASPESTPAATPTPPAVTTSPLPEASKPPVAKARHGSGSGAGGARRHKTPAAPKPAAEAPSTEAPGNETPSTEASTPAAPPAAPGAESNPSPTTVQVVQGDTLTKIARGLHAETRPAIDQTMIALFRSNPEAFGGNINVLKRGSVLRVPDADSIAALNQKEAMSEVHKQLEAWRSAGGGAAPVASGGRLRLVTPTGGSGTAAPPAKEAGSSSTESEALRAQVKDLQGQLSESKRLLELKDSELSALQQKLSESQAPAAAQPPIKAAPPPVPVPAPPVARTEPPPPPPPAVEPPASAVAPPAELPPAMPPPAPVHKTPAAAPPAAAPSGSWIDWVADHWWIAALPLALVVALLVFNARRKRRQAASEPPDGGFDSMLEETHVTDMRAESANKLAAMRRPTESYEVEESGPHVAPDFHETQRFSETGELKSAEDTLSSESAVNIDQGDPLAEADFHMAYGLYDQAADLVRIALEREPDRRDLRMKLLEIYFVWGNKDAFLQTAKSLETTRDHAPAGEWDKIVIMGKQICPEEPIFSSSTGGGRGAGALVDLNLEGGENRVDIDLFGEPEGHDAAAAESDATAATGESPQLRTSDPGAGLDFMLESPERDADDSPTREQRAARDEPTMESAQLTQLTESPTMESPVLKTAEMRSPRMPSKAEQTAEVSIDDLGLNLDHLEETGSPATGSAPGLEETDHPADAPTMVAGLDERSRRMMEEAANRRDGDLTELERELEASFIAELDSQQDEIKTAVLPPESAPTVLMPRERDASAQGTMRVKSPEFSDIQDPERVDIDSTSKLRGIKADSIDLDLDRLATALGSGDTVEQPRAVEEVFSSEVFEGSQRSRRVDLDVGESMNGAEHPTHRMAATNKLKSVDLSMTELEPVTMSEVGTKLDLARAYMDMGDPEGARSILEEVVQEGSASQKQEASRLIESLPG